MCSSDLSWLNPQNYSRDRKMIRSGELEDGVLAFEGSPAVENGIAPPQCEKRERLAGKTRTPLLLPSSMKVIAAQALAQKNRR